MFASKYFLVVLGFGFITAQSHAEVERHDLDLIQVADAFSIALAERDEERLLELWDPMTRFTIEKINPDEQLDNSDPLAFRQLQRCALDQTVSIEDPMAGSLFPIRKLHACEIFESSTSDVYSVYMRLRQDNDIWSVISVTSSTEAQRITSAENRDLAKVMALQQDPTERVHAFMERLVEKDYLAAAELSDGIITSQLEEISQDGKISFAWRSLQADGFFECIDQYARAELKIERSASSPFEARAFVCEDVKTEFGDVFRLSLWFDDAVRDWKVDGVAW